MGKSPNADLKEIEQRKEDRRSRIEEAPAFLLRAKEVVRRRKNGQNRLKILQFFGKTSASPRQYGDVMAQINIDTLDRKGVVFGRFFDIY